MKKILVLLVLSLSCLACKQNQNAENQQDSAGKAIAVDYAKGFSLKQFPGYKILHIKNAWPDSDKAFTYVLQEKDGQVPDSVDYDAKIKTPVNSLVATSTTHIPAIESLHEVESLKGFPGLKYISSKKVRRRIDDDKIKDLGKNESLNTEVLIDINPDVVVAFSMNNTNKSLDQVQKAGIPVIYNGDWTEKDPLGKAEWIKFFGALYGKLSLAQDKFDNIEADYHKALKEVSNLDDKPSVLAGSLYKDVWYLPYGDSWQGKMITDAGGNYLYNNTSGSGSKSLSLEEVLNKGREADKWIAPGSFTSYSAMKKASEHYTEFKAFKNREIYTMASTKGATGGVLYYELAPQRPDLVVKDLIKIFHPKHLPDYESVFFKPLKP